MRPLGCTVTVKDVAVAAALDEAGCVGAGLGDGDAGRSGDAGEAAAVVVERVEWLILDGLAVEAAEPPVADLADGLCRAPAGR